MVKVYAPASSANMSVGFDVLGAAVTPVDGALLGDVVTVEAAETFSLNNLGRFADKLPSEPRENIVYQCWERFCQELGKQIPVAMTLEKNMPIGSGLGSSACSVVAALMAMNEHCGKPLNDTRLLALMGELEGRISGSIHYDNVAPCFLGGMQLMIEENDIIFFYYNDEGENVVVAQIYKGRDEGIDGETVYYVHALDDAAIHTVNIASGHLLGVYSSHIQYLGTVSAYLTESAALMYGSLVLLGLLLFVVPIAVFVIRLKKRRMGSPFPEGVNINKLNTENLYIYENMRRFFAEAGVFTIEKGYDCDLIYIGKRLFAVLHCTNGNMYVNINKNFQRYDGKVDRAGYICIPHASSIPTAQKRVNSIYQAYFSNFKYMQARKRRRPRPNTATGLPRQNTANRLPR